MSIKTPKRLVLGVIASLVFAPFAAVAPASAVTTAITTSLPTALIGASGSDTSDDVTLGATVVVRVGFTPGAVLAHADDQTFTATTVTLSTPAGSTVTLADNDGANSTGTTAAFGQSNATTTDINASVNSTTGAVAANALTDDVPATAIVIGSITIKPDVAGTYKVNVTASDGAVTSVTIHAGDLYGVTADGLAGGAQRNTAINAVAGAANTVTLAIIGAANTTRLVTVTGSTISSVESNAGVTVDAGKTSLTSTATTAVTFTIATPTAGTITVNAFKQSQPGIYSTTVYGTVTITVNSAAVAGTIDLADSTAVLKGGATWQTLGGATVDSADVTLPAAAPASPTVLASIKVNLVAAAGTISSTTAVTAAISGPGSLVLNDENNISATPISSGRSISGTKATTTDEFYVFILADGTPGVSTITVTAGTFTKTKTVTFYGAVASYTVTANKAHIANNGTSTTDVMRVTALDAAGIKVPSATIYASVGTSTIGTITQSAVTDATGVAKFAATGVSTEFGAVAVTFGNKVSASTITATGSFGVASLRAASIAVTANKTSYLPGELMTLTFTAKDANGLGLPNGSYAAGDLLKNDAANPVASMSFPANPFKGDAALALKAGVVTATAYAPLVEGPVSFTWTVAGTAGGANTTNLAAALLETKVTLSVTVAKPVVPVVVPPVVYDNPTLSYVKDGARIILSGTAVDGEGDIIIYVKKVGTTAWKERAKTLEVAAPGDFNGSIKAPKANVLIRVKQEGTGQFSNQIIVLK